MFAKPSHTAVALRQRYDVHMFTTDSILLREIQCYIIDILMFWQRVQNDFGLNMVKYARITITSNKATLFQCIEICPVPWRMFENEA